MQIKVDLEYMNEFQLYLISSGYNWYGCEFKTIRFLPYEFPLVITIKDQNISWCVFKYYNDSYYIDFITFKRKHKLNKLKDEN